MQWLGSKLFLIIVVALLFGVTLRHELNTTKSGANRLPRQRVQASATLTIDVQPDILLRCTSFHQR
jgi:hypothetical protein